MRKIASIFDMLNYPTNLGRLEVNLRSLEVVIRIFLLTNEIGHKETTKFLQSLRTLKMDQEVEINQFTSYDPLNKLIEKYNEIVSKLYSELIINTDIIKLRDALAHGRAFYLEQSPPYTTMLLLKFSDPNKNKTTLKPKVEISDVMTKHWLDEKIKWTQNEYKKVIEASNRISKIKP